MNHHTDRMHASALVLRWSIAAAAFGAAMIPVPDASGNDNTRRGLVRPSGGGSGSSGGGAPAAQPAPPPRRDTPPPQSAPQDSSPPPASPPSAPPPTARLGAAPAASAAQPSREDRTRRLLVRPGSVDRSAFVGIPLPSGLDTARAAEQDNTVRGLVRRTSSDRDDDRWDGDRRGGDRSWNRYPRPRPIDWRPALAPQEQYYIYRDVVNLSPAPAFRYVPPQLGSVYNDLKSWNQWSWGVWDGRSASWGANAFFGDDGYSPRRYSSWWNDDRDAFQWWRPWDSSCWKVSEIITTTVYQPPPQFVQPVVQGGGTIILGYVPEENQRTADGAAIGVGRADEDPLPAGVNTAFDVVPLFTQAVNGANRGDYSAAIYAMRRAASVNPSALFGPGSRVVSVVAQDEQWAEEVRRARGVFENPPARVVSEADAAFMVAALCAALGESQCARQSITRAQDVGDQHSSTVLFRRALDGDDFGSASPWTPGRKLR